MGMESAQMAIAALSTAGVAHLRPIAPYPALLLLLPEEVALVVVEAEVMGFVPMPVAALSTDGAAHPRHIA